MKRPKKVKFVRSLNVEDANEFSVLGDCDFFRYYRMEQLANISPDKVIAAESSVADLVVVPLNRICNREGDEVNELYIAYSEEVEECLGLPFRVMNETAKLLNTLHEDALEEIRNLRNLVDNASFRARLKYLFTRKL